MIKEMETVMNGSIKESLDREKNIYISNEITIKGINHLPVETMIKKSNTESPILYKGEKLCDGDCNHCPIVVHENSRMLTKIFNQLFNELGDKVYEIVQNNCLNLTCCYDCRIDDFCHIEGCKLAD